ncbi:MAG: glycosyltransferase family 4 protein [Microthrixaceae bacterium]
MAPSPVPLRLGGAERHWETLRRSLEEAGIAADLVKVPVREHTLIDLVGGYEQFAGLDLSHADLVISGKYPAWMVSHPNHVVWMLHPLRGLYDTYNAAAYEADPPYPGALEALLELLGDAGAGATDSEASPTELIGCVREVADALGPAATEPGGALALPGPIARGVIHALDRWALDPRRVRRHLAISSVVAQRPGYFPVAVEPTVLIPPSCLAEPPSSAPPASNTTASNTTASNTSASNTTADAASSDTPTRFLAVGRLERVKRFDLAIAAMAENRSRSWELRIVGDGSDRERLENQAQGDGRITFSGRIDDDELARSYAASDAVIVTPDAEDFGYVTIEAFQAGRAVITTNDSGGPAELATDGVDSIVTAANPGAVGSAMARIADDPALAARLGKRARSTAAEHSWPRALTELLAKPRQRPVSPGRRGRIAALSTYPIGDWPGGGPQRARHLLGGLADAGWEVDVVTIAADRPGSKGRPHDDLQRDDLQHDDLYREGLTERSSPLSQRHVDADRQLRRLTANIAVTDITASVLWPSSPELVQAMRAALDGASAVVAVQPYLAPAARALAPGVPLVLDAHNHERTLKSQMLPRSEAGRWMLDRVADAETAAATARLVVATTEEDARSLEADNALETGSVVVVPNGVDTRSITVPDEATRASARARVRAELDPDGATGTVAVFVGSAHKPNVDAAHEITAIATGLDEVLFVLAGEHSDQLDAHDCPPNVVRLGAVSDRRLVELLAASDVAVNPMRAGGGSNLKVLRYFACGVPVLSTLTGMRGIEEPDRYATIARIDRFADAVAAVAADAGSPASLERCLRARTLVEEHYDWTVIANRFTALIDGAIAAGDSHG